MLLYLLKYFKCHSAVVVLQGGDVIVPEGEFSPSIYLQRDGHPFPINNNQSVITVIWIILVQKIQPALWMRHIIL